MLWYLQSNILFRGREHSNIEEAGNVWKVWINTTCVNIKQQFVFRSSMCTVFCYRKAHLFVAFSRIFLTHIFKGKRGNLTKCIKWVISEKAREKLQKCIKYVHSPLWILIRRLQLGVLSLLVDVNPYCIRSQSSRVFTDLWTFQLLFHHAFTFPFGHCEEWVICYL